MPTFDVIIIGGGPAGLSAALHLIQRTSRAFSPSILILEKERYPRPKLCAGGLTLDAERILQTLNLDLNEIPRAETNTAQFSFRGRGLRVRVPSKPALQTVRRDEFDFWLARQAMKAGVQILQGARVKNVVADSDGATVETDAGHFRAKVVVGADGSNGIARQCVLPHAPLRAARTLEILIDETSDAPARFDFFPVARGIAGYTWNFPARVKGQPMRCWGIYDANLFPPIKRPPLQATLAEALARHGFRLSDYELKSHPIRLYDPFSPLAAPRVLLVGDAAGADPLFGEGISIALGYGRLAAREIEEAFRKNDFSFQRYKRRVHFSGLGQTLLARWILAHLVYRLSWSWFQFLLWRVCQLVVLWVAWTFVLNWSKRLK